MKNSLVPTSEVLRPILTLGVGAVVAQLIPFVMSFILARLYSPDDFGELGLFINYAGILLILASARYELAIVRARSDTEARAVAVLSICLVVAFCVLLWLVVGVSDLLPSNYVSNIPGRYLLPAFVLASALFQIQLGVRNYQERYKSITVLTISRNVIQAISRLLLSLAHGLNGLIWGAFAGVGGAFLLSLRGFPGLWRGTSRLRLAAAARRYANFPKYVLPSSLLNTLSTNLPVILFALFFAERQVGYFTMTTTLLYLPVSLLAASIGQVFYKKASVWELGKVADLAWHILRFSGILSGVAFAIILSAGTPLFAFLLGDEWREIGGYATLLLPWFVLVLCFSPLSMIFDAKDHQRTEMWLNVAAFVCRTLAVVVGGHAALSAESVVLLYALGSIVGWFVEGVIIMRILRLHQARMAAFLSYMSLLLLVWGIYIWYKYI